MSTTQRSREISTFPIAPSILGKLTKVGLLSVEDVHGLKPSELSKEAKITPSEALEVLQTIFQDVNASAKRVCAPEPKTAWELLQEEQKSTSIVTFCESLDDMMGGGVPVSKITEFCGAPGIGKTQMCLQLAVDVQIPACLGGLEGEVVYIDTEGSFIVERMVDIASATLDHCQSVGGQGESDNLAGFTLDKILYSTHYYRVHDYLELVALVHLLPRVCQEHPRIKLVIIDSIACPFRQGFEDMSVRTRVLSTLTQSLIRLATQFSLAVVLTNQMTTRITSGSSHLVPALGESWGHASTIRVILHWERNQRKALLYKSPSKQEATCVYQVMTGGIRDVATEQEQEQAQANDKNPDRSGSGTEHEYEPIQNTAGASSVTVTTETALRRLSGRSGCRQQPNKKLRIS